MKPAFLLKKNEKISKKSELTKKYQ
jgi:hypothetical protein